MRSFLKSYLWIPALVGLLVYLPVLQLGSAWGDDHVVIDPIARDLKLMLAGFYKNIPGTHFFPFSFFQCYFINLIFGSKAFPFGFHLYQLICHVSACFFATLVLYKLTKNKLISIIVILMWTVHPINVETLTRLVCAPAHVPAGTFALIFLLCFLEAKDKKDIRTKVILLCTGMLFFLFSLTSYEQYKLTFPNLK